MEADDLVTLLGATLRFTIELPTSVPLVRKLWRYKDICFARKFETLLYAFYHWGVHVLPELSDECTALYNQFQELGSQRFAKEHVGLLLESVGGNKHEQWTLTAFVVIFIERVTQQTFPTRVSCRMQACICTMFDVKKPVISSCFQKQADGICTQLSCPTPQKMHIIYETPIKDVAQYPRHKKHKAQQTNNTKRLLVF